MAHFNLTREDKLQLGKEGYNKCWLFNNQLKKENQHFQRLLQDCNLSRIISTIESVNIVFKNTILSYVNKNTAWHVPTYVTNKYN